VVTLRLFALGYVWDVDLKQVAKLLNSSTHVIKAEIEDSIRNIGEPDLYGMGYSYLCLFGVFPQSAKNTVRVGITTAPIENNFFTKTNGVDAILVSIFQIDEFCEKSGRTKEEYLTHTILCQVLWIQYKARKTSADYGDLFHEATRGCIFDFCYNKADIVVGLRTCQIDPMCKGKLVEANVPESLVSDAELILERLRTPTFLKALQMGLQNPAFSFLLGGLVFGLVVNVLSSLALGEFDSVSDYYIVALLLLLAIALITGNYIRVLTASKRAKM
jgi:hypothetical protein